MTASTTLRIAGYAHVVVAVLCAGFVIGAVFGPTVIRADEDPAPIGEGVVAAEDGYRLVPVDAELEPDGGGFRFQVQDQEGRPIMDYEELHERPLHLIVVRRDLTQFHHVHPTLDEAGTWSVDLPALPAGSYRAITDFWVTDGPRLALGVDVTVPGTSIAAVSAEPTATSHVDGYDVTLQATSDETGEVFVELTVRRDGETVQPEPYLGANGHLVALRSGDLAYAHVHPDDEGEDRDRVEPGPIRFEANLDSAGRYGLFFDFRHDGAVHTATFTFDQVPVTEPVEMEMS